MALFSRGDKGKQAGGAEAVVVVGRRAHCRICDDYRPFSKCWLRMRQMTRCPGCDSAFEDVAELYRKFQPACPQCGEFLEQPGFEYGLCDSCGSKFELVQGTKPGLLPNRRQRAEMDKLGKVWRIE